MVWYAAEAGVAADMDRALELALDAELPGLLPFTVRRVAATESEQAVAVLATHLAATTDEAERIELLKGLNALVGREETAAQ